MRQTLRDCIDPKSLQSSDRFFKPGEQAKVYGICMAEVGKIAKEFFKAVSRQSKAEIFSLCEELLLVEYFHFRKEYLSLRHDKNNSEGFGLVNNLRF